MIKKGFAYNDVTIVPAIISNINSRSECNPIYSDGYLPIFASCMSTVINDDNATEFIENKINPIIPRNIHISKRLFMAMNGFWVAMSMKEFEEYFINKANERDFHCNYHICIDIANGHMKSLYDLCVKAKEIARDIKYYKLTIMTGNIANPETYKWICENALFKDSTKIFDECAIDYIRLSVGTGGQCVTSSNTGIHYPIASLIHECNKIKIEIDVQYKLPKIVADGGIRNFNDVIKALALGADYVMVGSLFAGMYESAAPLLIKKEPDNWSYEKFVEVDYKYENEEKKRMDIKNRPLWKECYGMSTKKAQELIDPNKKKKTAEGKHSMIKVQYTIKQWTENMIDYLKSAMSYCNAKELDDFIGKPEIIVNSPGTMMSVNK